MAGKKMDLGPTGETVAYNVRRLRGERTYKEMSEQLSKIGRPIPPLAVRRIEEGDRRVDADDLVALAVVLGVNPNALLIPHILMDGWNATATGVKQVPTTNIWEWAEGTDALAIYDPLFLDAPVDAQARASGLSRTERARAAFHLRSDPHGFMDDDKIPNVSRIVAPEGDADGDD